MSNIHFFIPNYYKKKQQWQKIKLAGYHHIIIWDDKRAVVDFLIIQCLSGVVRGQHPTSSEVML
jgi:hypothetical protein